MVLRSWSVEQAVYCWGWDQPPIPFRLYSVTMKSLATMLMTLVCALPAFTETPERLGTVSFPVSCIASQQVAINRGIALVHDFWYEESERQFEQILTADPACAMAHWGIAMSLYHQTGTVPATL